MMTTFGNIVDRIMETVGIQITDTAARNKIKSFVNMVYLNEVATQKPWKWLEKTTALVHKAYYADGTAAVTPQNTAVTLSTAPNVSLGSFANRKFSIDGSNKVYTIASHTAGSAAIVLTSEYQEAVNATAEFKIWRDRVDLPANAKEVTTVWHSERSAPLQPVGPREYRRYEAKSPKEEGYPSLFNVTDFFDPSSGDAEAESDRYRQLQIYPAVTQTPVTINIDYIQEAVELEDETDEPLMPVGDRIVLYYLAGALAWLNIGRNPETAGAFEQKGQAKLAKMTGDVDPGHDKPTLSPSSPYLSAIRRSGLRKRSLGAASNGGNSSVSLPTYLQDVTIDGANVTDDITVVADITIDGRDISEDGAALDDVIADLEAHIDDVTDAHTASAITNVPSGNLIATNVQQALQELQTELDGVQTDITALETLADGKIYVGNASNVATEVTPAGDVTIANDGTTAISSGVIVNDDVNASAAIAQSKLVLSITNSEVNAAAAIDWSKMANLTASRALISDGSGDVSAATTTATEIGYVNGVTSAIQTQLDAKQARSTLTTKGDLYVATASATVARQGVGTDGQYLAADSTQTNGIKWATFTPPTQQIFTSGSGTYTTPTGVKWLRVKVQAAGGGGCATNGSANSGGAGGSSTFGAITANGGAAGVAANSGGAATASGGDLNISGGTPGCATSTDTSGGFGGGSILGFGGAGTAGTGTDASGYGGGGAAAQYFATNVIGGGGGAYAEKIYTSPASSYSYAVGAAGAAGSAGVWSGGAGTGGIIIVEEYYQ